VLINMLTAIAVPCKSGSCWLWKPGYFQTQNERVQVAQPCSKGTEPSARVRRAAAGSAATTAAVPGGAAACAAFRL
jgi:hypothetical protein